MFDWVSDSMQKHIAVWELMAQLCLAFCLVSIMPCMASTARCIFAIDNMSAEAASSKGLSTSLGLDEMLAAWFHFQRVHALQIDLRHIPGRWNHVADDLSRDRLPQEIHDSRRIQIPWAYLCSFSVTCRRPVDARFPPSFGG